VKHQPGADPGAVAYDAYQFAKARNVDVLLVDTAGRLHTKTPLMDELGKVRRVIEKEGKVHEALLVIDATAGQNGLVQAREFAQAAGVTGVVLTKLDGTAKGGIALAIEDTLGIPIKLIGVGEGVDDLEPFDPKTFVDALLT
jgi:fused signal recognition particle receptor